MTSALFVGIAGTVLAIDRGTGAEVWRSRLLSSDFVNVFFDGAELYAATAGELFRLDPATGQILWHNQLKGLGCSLLTISSADNNFVAVKERRQEGLAGQAVHRPE
jgi:outer membrane protein assembly factor BamB